MAKIPQKIEKMLNEQINAEFQANYNYLGMAAYFEGSAFKGFANWMKEQAEEEHKHGLRIFEYLADRSAKISLGELGIPKSSFKSTKDAFETALKYEQSTTASIHRIYDAALSAKDFGTLEMLNWFIKEQVEEEASAQDMLDRVVLAGNDPSALLRLDHEAGKRKAE